METKYILKLEEATLHLSCGNSKLGKIVNFSTIPGNETHRPILKMRDENYKETGEQKWLTNVIGTCSKYCDNCAKSGACYAWHSLCFHHNKNAKPWGDNTLLLRSGKVFDLIDEELSNNPRFADTKLFRINNSGELENLEQLVAWNTLASKHPDIKFAIYTKNYDVLDEFVNKYSDTVNNLVINVSQWNHVADDFLNRHPNQFNVFEYDGTYKKHEDHLQEDIERLFKTKHCPAVLKNGTHAKTKEGITITCTMCGRCYRKTKETTAVYAH